MDSLVLTFSNSTRRVPVYIAPKGTLQRHSTPVVPLFLESVPILTSLFFLTKPYLAKSKHEDNFIQIREILVWK
jgi:hypothetical protein